MADIIRTTLFLAFLLPRLPTFAHLFSRAFSLAVPEEKEKKEKTSLCLPAKRQDDQSLLCAQQPAGCLTAQHGPDELIFTSPGRSFPSPLLLAPPSRINGFNLLGGALGCARPTPSLHRHDRRRLANRPFKQFPPHAGAREGVHGSCVASPGRCFCTNPAFFPCFRSTDSKPTGLHVNPRHPSTGQACPPVAPPRAPASRTAGPRRTLQTRPTIVNVVEPRRPPSNVGLSSSTRACLPRCPARQ